MPDAPVPVTIRREPFRTEVEHLPDGKLLVRQHCYMVLRNAEGQKVGQQDGYITVELRDKELAAEDRAAIEHVFALLAAKPYPPEPDANDDA